MFPRLFNRAKSRFNVVNGPVVQGTFEKGVKRKGKLHQFLSIRYGSAKYSVKAEPSKKMAKVMNKLSKKLGRESLIFKVESSGRAVTGDEKVEELLGEVLVVNQHNRT